MVSTTALDAHTPDDAEARLAGDLSRMLSPFVREGLSVYHTEGEQTLELPLTAHIVRILVRVLNEIARGNAVTIVPIHAELTTQQAADLLGVSRPFLIGLLEDKQIPFRLVGTHRRIRFTDLARYQERQGRIRNQALDELSAIGQELELDD